ncbi:hypothetical protein N7527_001150 [Penicillium freii]|nr:hypothetical protein N7527_001150 [Penicillium freii]
MIGGLVSKKPGKVDIRRREGTKNEELTLEITLEITLEFTGVTEWERIGKEPSRKYGFTMEKYGSAGAKTRGCIGICSRYQVHAVSEIQLGECGVTFVLYTI